MTIIDVTSKGFYRSLIYVFLPLFLAAIGYFAFEYQKSALEETIGQQLIAVRDLKLTEIEHWISVWKKNANLAAKNSSLSEVFATYINGPENDTIAKERLKGAMERLDAILQTLGTSLFDRQGRLIISTHPGMAGEVQGHAHEAPVRAILNLGEILISPLRLPGAVDQVSDSHLEVYAPITVRDDQREWTVGVIAITVNAEDYLYPLIRKWPTPSDTAETLLVEREGDQVMYLNNLRFLPGSGLRLRMPLSREDLPAALVIKGVEGVIEGVDYRGAKVIAAVRAIPGTPWYIAAKVDKEELYAPIRRWQAVTIVAVLVLTLLGLAMLRMLWSLEAKQRAERATKAKSEFLANMSHEIRTPLNAIVGFAETLRDGGLSEDERTRINATILRNSKYLMDVVNDILDLSKIEAEKIEIEKAPTNAIRIVQDISDLMTQRASEKGLVFKQEFIFPLPEQIISDCVRLKQILLNLVSNAVKFTDSGFVMVRAGVHAADEIMWFEISDTGPGMSSEEVARVFDRFYQGAGARRMTRGTGLGLTISKRLAQLLGGDLTIESEKGKGTKCILTVKTGRLGLIPFVHEAVPLERVQGDGGSERRIPKLQGAVLLMEDNGDTQQLMTYLIRKTGADVVVAENGKVGVEAALRNNFDLLIVDMHMPEMDGCGAIRLLKEKNLAAPMIVLSADPVKDRLQRCLEIGCDDYFVKPFERDAFYRLLERYLKPAVSRARSQGEIALDDPQYQEIVEGFANGLPARLDAIANALAAGDLREVEMAAHKLASAALFGFAELGAVAQELQKRAAEKDEGSAKRLFEKLKIFAYREPAV